MFYFYTTDHSPTTAMKGTQTEKKPRKIHPVSKNLTFVEHLWVLLLVCWSLFCFVFFFVSVTGTEAKMAQREFFKIKISFDIFSHSLGTSERELLSLTNCTIVQTHPSAYLFFPQPSCPYLLIFLQAVRQRWGLRLKDMIA